MARSNSILNYFYKTFRPPGHFTHLEHIIDGRFSNMDRVTLKYHLARNLEKLSKGQIDILRNILRRGVCSSKTEINAVNALKMLVDPQGVYFAPGLFNIVYLGAPLLAGILSIIVLASTAIFDKGLFQPTVSKSTETQFELSLLTARIEDTESKLSKLKQEITVLSTSPLLAEKIKVEIKNLITEELSRLSREPNTNRSETSSVLMSSFVQQTQRSLKEIDQKYQLIQGNLNNIESLVADKPENIINLRLLQRDVAELSNQVSKKVDMELLREKEIRLTESISKDVLGLSRELEILRWVVYLLVIGLTASGGLIVVMQRRR